MSAPSSSAESSSPPLSPSPNGVRFLYMLTNRKPGVATATQLGCCSDVDKRVALFNSEDIVPGSDRRARQAAGWWKPVLVIAVPRASAVSARALVCQWKTGARKIHCRFEYGVNMARCMSFAYVVDLDELRQDVRIVEHAKATIDWLEHAMDDSPDRVKRMADVVAAANLPAAAATATAKQRPLPTTWQGLSFARVDRPRRRYQKSQQRRDRKNGSSGGGKYRRTRTGGVNKLKTPPRVDVAQVLAQAPVA